MNKYLLPLLVLTLAACAPTPEELDDIKKSYSTPQMGFSGLVTVQHADLDLQSPQLPPQISVEFEKKATIGNHLSLYKTSYYPEFPHTNEDFVSIGCNASTDIAELPAYLNVGTLQICGYHRLNHNTMNITANMIILENASLEFIPGQALQSNRIEMNSKIFWVDGKNTITLQGAKISGGRALAPTLNLNAGLVTGVGHVNILSKANIFSVKLK
ncbi:hypothetical protein EZJ49_09860 [Bdellovibrio bacteriovorus]|uniref:hypothetical protein n=1 Tax=Bdellovibrio bacteriovorus TaxID=959 RepID=UPI0021CE1E13|nr:hypothetical protein [Bdellovibrio bacteriovorus]UXR63379.1 hypothetical protein EZJ49_09860 [Bdellovibrio bacteriovorus]